MKEMDNMSVIHVDAIATVMNILLSSTFFGLKVTWLFWMGTSCVLFGLYAFRWNPSESSAPALSESANGEEESGSSVDVEKDDFENRDGTWGNA